MLSALVLVCSLAATPNLADCDQKTAVDVLRVAEDFESPTTCLMHGQAYLAQTTLGRDLRESETVKIVCTRISKIDERARVVMLR